jgi:hypothetical protein
MWSDVRHPALKPICSLRIISFLRIYFSIQKVYACFIDLRKAFDSVIHSALFLKLLRAKIGGKFLALLKFLYSNLSLTVIVNSQCLSFKCW